MLSAASGVLTSILVGIFLFKISSLSEEFVLKKDKTLGKEGYKVRIADRVSVSAPEEIAYRYRWISKSGLIESAKIYGKSPYGEHLLAVAEGRMIK